MASARKTTEQAHESARKLTFSVVRPPGKSTSKMTSSLRVEHVRPRSAHLSMKLVVARASEATKLVQAC